MRSVPRLVFKFAIAFVLLFGIAGCKEGNQPHEDIVTLEEVEKIIITDDKAKSLFENYGKHRGNIIEIYENNGRRLGDSIPQNQQDIKDKKQADKAKQQEAEKGFVPVQYTYYDFEKFKKYLKFIEQETKKAGADISTLRIYFANYPENEKDNDKRKRNTVMFVPTIKIEGTESAYYISDDGQDGKSRPYLLTDSFGRTNKPAPTGSLDTPRNTSEANLLPNVSNSLSPSLIFAEQSVIGNEGNRNPPSHH